MSLSIASFSFDQAAYTTGETITLTVNYTTTDAVGGSTSTAYSATATVADSTNTASAVSTTGNTDFPFFTVTTGSGTPSADTTTVSATDNRTPAGTWSVVSNTVTGSASPWTGVAVLTSVA